MSQRFYGQMWGNAQGALEELLKEELPTAQCRPQNDHLQAFQTMAMFYLRYLQIFRALEEVYDQIVHPQKRNVVRQVLEGVMGRLVELKSEMVDLESSEYHYFDDLLQDLKMTPEDLEVPIPRYFVRERIKALKEREKMLDHILTKGQHQQHKRVSSTSMSVERAVWLLQVSERARQGRLRAHFMKKIQQQKRRQQQRSGSGVLDPDLAAINIQKTWRGYRDRKKVNRKRLEEMVFLKMINAEDPEPCPSQVRVQLDENRRHDVQEEHESEYLRALTSIKVSVQSVDGPNIKETLQDQIRQWFLECRDATGKFPDFPSAEDGGSSSLFAQKTPEQVAAELAAKKREKKKLKEEKEQNYSAGKDMKKGKVKNKQKKGDVDREEEGWKMAPSNFLSVVAEGAKLYNEVWRNRDEKHNFVQSFDPQLIREEKRLEVEGELRIQVDELMRQELKNLKLVVDKDKGKKKKKAKKKGNKKKKKKGRKSGKKKQKQKDLTNDRTIESLYEELVNEGIIIKPMDIKLSDYIGEYNYLGTTLRQANVEPMPSLSDVRQLIALYGILPLGSQFVHERGPLIRALMLTGPAGVGKKMLVHALCSETGANLFNLTSTTLAGKYPGKSGPQYILQMVFKVARQLQPSVIWIDDAEKTFYKKVPKLEKEMEPKKLKKHLPKVLKSIKSEDRVLLVGTSRRPFDADLKPFCKVYKKIILIPRPDYASRFSIWKKMLQANGAVIGPKLDLSSLAKVTDGYTQSHILQAIQSVLNSYRIKQQSKKPLRALEFIPPLARLDPIYKEEEEAFKTWYSRTPLGKKQTRANRASEGGNLKERKKQAGRSQKKIKGPKKKKRMKKK